MVRNRSGAWTLLGLCLFACGGGADRPEARPEPGSTKDGLGISSAMKLATGRVTAVANAWTTVTLPSSYASMIVVATPAYGASSPPLVTRIRNATGTSFDLRVDRFDGKTGSFAGVSVDYLAVEEGQYSATSGIKMEAAKFSSTVTDHKGSWNGTTRSYRNGYSHPVVLGQVLTYADARPSVFWSRGSSATAPPSSTVLRVGKHVGEDPQTTRATETIGYVVVEAGMGTIGGVAFQAALGADVVQGLNAGPASYSLATPGATLRAVLSQSGMDGGDGSWALLSGSAATTGSSLLVNVDEDNVGDSERSHSPEQVAFFTINQCPSAATRGQPCDPGGACAADGTCCPDGDRDGVCDGVDACPGSDDRVDTDHDGKPDGCDPCPLDASDDTDGDGVCDSMDVCASSDDRVDTDHDGKPDGCDPCPADNPDDSDGDGVCNSKDACPGSDDRLDADHDGVPDGCDVFKPTDCVPGATGQGIYAGDVTLTSASSVPDSLRGIVCITGSLNIDDYQGSSLTNLESLLAVGQSLRIQSFTLGDLSALGAVQYIGGTLWLEQLGIGNLDAFAALRSVSGVHLQDTLYLLQIDALSFLTSVPQGIFISGAYYTTLHGLRNLTSIDGGLVLRQLATADLSELANLVHVDDVDLSLLPMMQSLHGLEGITSLSGGLRLSNIPIEALSGLDNLTTIGGGLTVDAMPNLLDFYGLGHLESVGGRFTVTNNRLIDGFGGLGALTHVQDASVQQNALLPECQVDALLSRLGGVSCSTCDGNTGTADCSTNDTSRCWKGSLTLRTASDIELLGHRTCLHGSLTADPDPSVISLRGLERLTSISGDFVMFHTMLSSMEGLSGLTTIGGDLKIDTTGVDSLSGLSALTRAGGFFVRSSPVTHLDVPRLTDVSFWNVTNTGIPPCEVLELERRLQKGCVNCAYGNGSSSALCQVPVDGWVDQVTGDNRYQVTFASGGGACCFESIAEAHATYPQLNLADPVYDGDVVRRDSGDYMVSYYNGGGVCCYATTGEAMNQPGALLHPPAP